MGRLYGDLIFTLDIMHSVTHSTVGHASKHPTPSKESRRKRQRKSKAHRHFQKTHSPTAITSQDQASDIPYGRKTSTCSAFVSVPPLTLHCNENVQFSPKCKNTTGYIQKMLLRSVWILVVKVLCCDRQ